MTSSNYKMNLDIKIWQVFKSTKKLYSASQNFNVIESPNIQFKNQSLILSSRLSFYLCNRSYTINLRFRYGGIRNKTSTEQLKFKTFILESQTNKANFAGSHNMSSLFSLIFSFWNYSGIHWFKIFTFLKFSLVMKSEGRTLNNDILCLFFFAGISGNGESKKGCPSCCCSKQSKVKIAQVCSYSM